MTDKNIPLDSNITALKEMVVKTLDNNKADAIVEIDLRGKASFSDYMIIASGGSGRQVAALANRLLEEAAKNFPEGKRRVEGMAEADWVLVDLGDVIVHLFRPEVRSFYSLEKMWSVTVPATEHRRMVNKTAD